MATMPNKGALPGDNHYRAYIGTPEVYDLMSANQFNIATDAGLREHHKLLDVGCGSLRVGKLFMMYLLPGNYYGLEPNKWLVTDGLSHEIGSNDVLKTRMPGFNHNDQFDLDVFNTQFDFIIAQSVITHTTQDQMKTLITNASKVLKPGGIMLASCHIGSVDWEGTEWHYPGTHGFKKETVNNMAKEVGLSSGFYKFPHPEGCSWYFFQK